MIGPVTAFSQQLHAEKYRGPNESFDDYTVRFARAANDGESHFRALLDALRDQRLLPAGRMQLAVGRPHRITAINCFVGDSIDDSMEGIFKALTKGALTLRTGGGVGWDFSTLRPAGDPIRGLGFRAYSSGPVSFMGVWDAMCRTILSAGRRRGAMMGILRVDHPDILAFIKAKQDQTTLAMFNVSVAVTDAFMAAVENGDEYELGFNGASYGRADARQVFSTMMENNWDWAEPGVIFIDRINCMNPLGYCETIAGTNPCSEQPLPPNGACLLGSLNLVKYLTPRYGSLAAVDEDEHGSVKLAPGAFEIDFDRFGRDVETAVRAFDRVIDTTFYPLEEQKVEAEAKRRMGLGLTGVGNALEVCGHAYASEGYLALQDQILESLRDIAYEVSVDLAKSKGAFPTFQADGWLGSGFAETLPDSLRENIAKHGLRNGLLLSIAPTGTISLTADNVSSGIEPPYALEARRTIATEDGPQEVEIADWAWRVHGVRGRTAQGVTAAEHVDVLCRAQAFIDSAVSKTCNVNGVKTANGDGDGVTFKEFKQLYLQAYEGGAKGCTTFNINGKRAGIIEAADEPEARPETDGGACFIDAATGERGCEA